MDRWMDGCGRRSRSVDSFCSDGAGLWCVKEENSQGELPSLIQQWQGRRLQQRSTGERIPLTIEEQEQRPYAPSTSITSNPPGDRLHSSTQFRDLALSNPNNLQGDGTGLHLSSTQM